MVVITDVYKDVLIYDIETYVPGVLPDSTKDELRVFACYSYKSGKYYTVKNNNKADIQKIIDSHRFIVGFNNVGSKEQPGYDNPILEREGLNLKYKNSIDLRKIIKMRASQMKTNKGMLGDVIMEYSLDYITRVLDIVKDEDAKMHIDKSVFKKKEWTKAEEEEIITYARRDIEVTKKLYEWVENYFSVFRDFINEHDVEKKVYLTSSIAGFAYKAICKAMNWTEDKGDEFEDDEQIAGGYVAYPAGEFFEGDIYCIDFNSLYPSIMHQCNLHGRKVNSELDGRLTWSGKNIWKVEGTYYADELSGVGKLFRRWFEQRIAYKKANDRREYTIKIVLNASYGILNNPYYKRVYDRVAGGDCTRLGRQWVIYSRKVFREEGYTIIYSDTDSDYLIDNFHDKQRVLATIKKVIDYIKSTVPFSYDIFNMSIDDEIKYMYFFKGGNKDDEVAEEIDVDDFANKAKGFMKKNYIYVTNAGKVVVKNLGIKKKSSSALARKIFWEHLVPEIKQGKIKFTTTYINNLMYKLLSENIRLALMRKEVGLLNDYKSKTCLAAQIAGKYGAGIHFLIPNLKGMGIGKGKSFCTLDEFNAAKLTVNDIDTKNFWLELDYFIKPVTTKNIFEYS